MYISCEGAFLPKYKKLHTYFHLYCKDFIQIAFQF